MRRFIRKKEKKKCNLFIIAKEMGQTSIYFSLLCIAVSFFNKIT